MYDTHSRFWSQQWSFWSQKLSSGSQKNYMCWSRKSSFLVKQSYFSWWALYLWDTLVILFSKKYIFGFKNCPFGVKKIMLASIFWYRISYFLVEQSYFPLGTLNLWDTLAILVFLFFWYQESSFLIRKSFFPPECLIYETH